MKIKVELTVENSIDVAQIDVGVTEATVAGQIRDEFKQMLMGQMWGNDINGKPVVADIVGVEVFANSDDTSVFSEWHKED